MTDLEVAYDRARRLWVVRPFRRDDDDWTFANYEHKADAVKTAGDIADILRANPDGDGSCEVFTRRKNGTLGDRSTYGRDPIESVG